MRHEGDLLQVKTLPTLPHQTHKRMPHNLPWPAAVLCQMLRLPVVRRNKSNQKGSEESMEQRMLKAILLLAALVALLLLRIPGTL